MGCLTQGDWQEQKYDAPGIGVFGGWATKAEEKKNSSLGWYVQLFTVKESTKTQLLVSAPYSGMVPSQFDFWNHFLKKKKKKGNKTKKPQDLKSSFALRCGNFLE